MRKRILPALLALVMVLGLLPVSVFAAGTATAENPVVKEDDKVVSVWFGGFADTPANWLKDAQTQKGKLVTAHSSDAEGTLTLSADDLTNSAAFKNAILNYNGVMVCIEAEAYTTDEDKAAVAELQTYYNSITAITAKNIDGLDNIDFMQAFTKVETLDISGNESLTNLNALEYCTELKTLDASSCGLKDETGNKDGITGLAYCTKLEALNLSGNTGLTNLDALAGVETVDGEDNKTYNAPLTALTTVNVSDSGVKSLAPLAQCDALDGLNLSGTELNDLGDVDKLIDLGDGLDMSGTTLKAADAGKDAALAAAAQKLVSAVPELAKDISVETSSGTTTYLIILDQPEHGTVRASVGAAAEGAEVTVGATPAEGYSLEKITVTGADDSEVTVTNNKFTMPAGNVTVSAAFTKDPDPVTDTKPQIKYTDRTGLQGSDKTKYFGGKLEITNPNDEAKTYLVSIGDPSLKVGGKTLSITYIVTVGAKQTEALACQNVFKVLVAEHKTEVDFSTTDSFDIPDADVVCDWTAVTAFK